MTASLPLRIVATEGNTNAERKCVLSITTNQLWPPFLFLMTFKRVFSCWRNNLACSISSGLWTYFPQASSRLGRDQGLACACLVASETDSKNNQVWYFNFRFIIELVKSFCKEPYSVNKKIASHSG